MNHVHGTTYHTFAPTGAGEGSSQRPNPGLASRSKKEPILPMPPKHTPLSDPFSSGSKQIKRKITENSLAGGNACGPTTFPAMGFPSSVPLILETTRSARVSSSHKYNQNKEPARDCQTTTYSAVQDSMKHNLPPVAWRLL